MKRLAIFVILTILLIAGNSATVISQQSQDTKRSETYIIVYDEAHGQFFTSDKMSTALSSLNQSLDTEEVDVTIELILHTDPFNSTNLQGADLLMITNPGIENGTVSEVEASEKRAINNLVDIGGSVLYMSNPVSHNRNITGQGDALNDLIYVEFGATVNTAEGNTTVIADDFNHRKNSTFVELDSTNFNDQTLATELNNITVTTNKSILYYGGHIQENNGEPGPVSGNTSSTAYIVNSQFDVSQFQNSPRWLYGRDFQLGGKGMLVGSTVMFSDYKFDNNTKWVEQDSNLKLFQNMAAWLLGITPLPENLAIVTEPFGFFVRTNLLYALGLGLGLFAISVIIFMYRGRISPGELLDIFIEKEGSSKDSSKSSSKSKSKKKRQRSERRKRV